MVFLTFGILCNFVKLYHNSSFSVLAKAFLALETGEMSDDLGDFFAKKDKRKKKKKGTKVTSATLIDQLISDPGKTEEQPKQQFTDEAHIARPVSIQSLCSYHAVINHAAIKQ